MMLSYDVTNSRTYVRVQVVGSVRLAVTHTKRSLIRILYPFTFFRNSFVQKDPNKQRIRTESLPEIFRRVMPHFVSSSRVIQFVVYL